MILVTGGAGFIGSHVADALLAEGHEVRVVDALLPAAHRERPGYVAEGAEWLEGDLRDPESAARAVAGVTAVSHQAAMVGPRRGPGRPARVRGAQRPGDGAAPARAGRDRVRGPARARLEHGRLRRGPLRLRRARGRRPPPARRRTTSTPGGSSRAARACDRALAPQTVPEDAPLDPRSVYAATKLAQEHLCGAFARETGVPVTALRYHNVYGPRMPRDTPYAGVASIFRSAFAAGRPPRVFEDGGQRRDFVHVRDVARANVLALTAPEPVPGAFNVASGTPRTVLEMARALAAACDAPPGAAPQVTGEWRAGDVRHIVASPERARERLGFAAAEDFGAGMAEFAAAPLRG